MNDMAMPVRMPIEDIIGMREGMLGCARGMVEHLREEAAGIERVMEELDLIEVELRLLGARR